MKEEKHDLTKMGRGRRWREKKKRRGEEKVVNLSGDPGFQDLLTWLRGLGFKGCQNLRLAHFPGVGRGLQAAEDIKAGEVLLSIPLPALVTRAALLQTHPYSLGPHLSTQALFSLWLLLSPPAPYLSSLPTAYTCMYFLPPSHRELLPIHLRQCLQKQIALVDKDFEEVSQVYPGLDRSRFEWAWFTVNTRAVFLERDPRFPNPPTSPEDSLALAPYLDLLNHHPEAAVVAGINLDPTAPPGFQIITKKAIKKGSQVFIHYGAHSNISLLVEYGFIIPNNSDDGIPLTLEQLLVASSLSTSPSTLAKLKDAQMHLGIALSPKSGLSWSGLACLRIISLNLGEHDDWSVIYEEELDHLPQAKDAIKGVAKETEIAHNSLLKLKPEVLSNESLRGCLDLLGEQLIMLEDMLLDFEK